MKKIISTLFLLGILISSLVVDAQILPFTVATGRVFDTEEDCTDTVYSTFYVCGDPKCTYVVPRSRSVTPTCFYDDVKDVYKMQLLIDPVFDNL